MEKEKKNNIDRALAQINKTMGAATVSWLGKSTSDYAVKVFSTGSITLDAALGVWGLPFGRIVEIYGPESSGKTTTALFCIAEVQKMGQAAAFIDVEHALDLELAKQYGVNIDDLVISQPDTGEDALQVAEALIRTGEFGCIIVDSVSALLPEAEAEGTMHDQQIGLQARLMSKGLRKLTGACSSNDCTLIFINQIREKVGGYGE